MIVYARDIETASYRWNTDKMRHIANIGGIITTIVDRTGNMNGHHNYLYDRIPNDGDWRSFENCCFDAARMIWNRKKPVYVSWSGGIDSTAALIILHWTKPLAGELHVHYTPESIREYPLLYEKLVKHISDPVPHIFDREFHDSEKLIVSGNCGDALFGTDVGVIADRHWALGDPIENIEKWPIDFLCKRRGREEDRADIIEAVYEFCSYSPIPVKTVFDMYWWINFNAKWMHVQRKIPIKYAQSDNWRTYESFYNTQAFQWWAIQNQPSFHQGNKNAFKWQAKNMIYRYTQDADYRDNKPVIASGLEVQPYDDCGPDMIKLITYTPYDFCSRTWRRDDECTI